MRALYADEMQEAPEADSLSVLLDADPPGDCDLEFARRLHDLVRRDSSLLDREIDARLENWDLTRLALIDLLLLRIALAEFHHFPDIPHRVTLNEVIELAKQYSGARASAFVNGVLDGVLHHQDAPGEDTGSKTDQDDSPA